MSSSAEEDDCMIKLDTNIEFETIVRNSFEELDDPSDLSLSFIPTLPTSFLTEKAEDRSNESELDIDMKEFSLSYIGSDYCESTSSAKSEDSSYSSTDQSIEDDPKVKSSAKDMTSSTVTHRYKDINCKELIVFCIDMSSDMEKVPFIVSDEKEYTPLSLTKKVIRMFVHNKHSINANHKFALMILYETASWVCEFTSQIKEFEVALQGLTETLECQSCDLASVFSLIGEKYPYMLSREHDQAVDFQSVLRVILIYGRSNCFIEFSDEKAQHYFMDSPNVFLDVLYLHEPDTDENKCSEIYDQLCALDCDNKSYILEVERSVTNLHNSVGRLLAHPLQRMSQRESDYQLDRILQEHLQQQDN